MTRKEMIERLMKGEDPLDLGIEKWRDIVEHLKKISSFEEYDERLEKGQYNCALCELYLKDKCIECPVTVFGVHGGLKTLKECEKQQLLSWNF
ncbi:MAG: hypothetical protein B5M53_06320 [Candidatus Cloacimonas sp. 4484_209]|nr:MAG: hypothetical protein B5M53_06320 [Candidatus Cloacimonas sp. 4484_209]